MRSSRLAVSVLLVAATSCFSPARIVAQETRPTPARDARAGLPPVEDFFGRPKYLQFSLSPDGKLFAAMVPALDRQNLALIDLEKGTAKLLTSFTTEDVYTYRWVGDRMLEVQTANIADAGGVRVRRIALIDTEGRLVRDLRTMGQRGAAQIIATLDRDGEQVIVQSYERNVASLDAYLYTPKTNRMRLLTLESPGDVAGFVADRAGQVRAALSFSKDGKRQMLLSVPKYDFFLLPPQQRGQVADPAGRTGGDRVVVAARFRFRQRDVVRAAP